MMRETDRQTDRLTETEFGLTLALHLLFRRSRG